MFAKRGQKNFVEIDGYCWNKKQTTGISVRQTNPGHLGERGGGEEEGGERERMTTHNNSPSLPSGIIRAVVELKISVQGTQYK